MSDLDIIPDSGEEQSNTIRQLETTQREVTGPDYASQAGLTGARPAVQTEPDSWGALVKEHPVLSQRLTDPQFAYHAKDDVPNLSYLERLFKGWDEMAWKSKLELEADSRNQRLAAIGRAQRNGTATPEMLKEADGLDQEAVTGKGPELGFVPGIVPSVIGGAPGMLRALPTAAMYGAGGLLAGTLLTKNPKAGVAAAGAMAGAGFTVGMALDTARTEQGLAYREYVKAGADPQTAGVASDLVALANGGLQSIPAEKVLNLVPGLSRLLVGKETRDVVRRLISSNTGRAAMARFAVRAGESGLLMALVSSGQELVRELGAEGAGADDRLHADRIMETGVGGLQQGLGFGIAHAGQALPADMHEVRLGEARVEMFKAIAGTSADSKFRESMPDQFKQYVNSVVAEHGNVKEATAPAEKLAALFQAEGISQDQIERDMPTVAKQLKTAKPSDEITIPMGDLATHLAPLKSFPGLSEDLRVGDSLTARESKEARKQAEKFAAEKPSPEGDEEVQEPARRVYDDVYTKLVNAGQSPEVAEKDAALWAAFSSARGERTGEDPFDYYSKRAVNIGAEFPNAATNLMQRGEIRAILAKLPKDATLTDLRHALEGEEPKITDKELQDVRALRAQADKIEDFGEGLKKKLVSGADIGDDQLTEFLATEKSRKAGRVPTEQEINDAISRAQEFTLQQPVTSEPGLEQGANSGYRGKISFDEARSFFNITLTSKANLSTFLHESGHAFFEFLRMDAEDGHAQSKEDFGKLLDWMGVKDGEKPSTEHLENFARGFEAYLMEGKAPAAGLRDLFRTFAGWLKYVYHSIKSLNVDLTDEVRGVMDRMIASDAEIEKARRGLGLEPMKKPEGMSDAEFATYREKFSKALEESRERLERDSLKEFRKTIGEERVKVRKEVEAETGNDPARNAYEALRTGKRLGGTEVPEEIRGKKLSREAVQEFPEYSDSAKWTAITEPNGLDPEIAAPYFGYKSGEELLTHLAALKNRAKEIKEETERRMMERYPNAAIAKMQDEAVKAVHETRTVRDVLWSEARETAKQLRGLEKIALTPERPEEGTKAFRVLRESIAEYARIKVNEMTGIEMQPGKFSRAEARHAAEWAENMRKGDFEKAYQSKLDQIEAHEMFRKVSEARNEIDSIREYLTKFEELATRRKMGKAGQNYLGAIDAILQDVELTPQTNKALARRASLESYLSAMEGEDGALLTIPPELRSEAGLKNYRQMTLDELRTVRDAVKNVESMARLKNKLFDGREQRNYQETAIRAAEHIASNLGNPYAEKPGAAQNPGWFERKKLALRKSVAEMKKIEFLVRAMDGGQTAGFLHEILFQPLADAETKAIDLKRAITDKLLAPLKAMSMKERFELDKTVDFLGTPMKMRDVIAVALNMGNDGNKKKLLDGYLYRGWTEEGVTKRLGELLTDKHLDLVEHFWKTIGSLWPEIKGLSERTTGLAPPKVEPTKLTIRGRELEGGYYPIVYDRDRSYKAEQIAQRKGDLFENNFLKPNVSKGFTEARTQFAAPLLLSLNVIPAHVQEVIHYLTHFEPVRAVDRLMAHSEMRRAVVEGLGRETYNLFRPWLQAIAADGAVHENTTTIDNVLRHLRVGASVTRLGFRLTNSIMQGFNLLSSVKELGGLVDGPKYLALGMKTYMRELESLRDPFGPLMDPETGSPEMRGKAAKMEQTLIGGFDEYASAFGTFGAYKEKLAHFSLSFMALAWKSVEAMTWYAAREKAFAEDHPHPREYADSVLRLAQMGEGMKDKAAIMRGGEGTKIFTYMYSWYSTIFNQLTETQPRDRGNWKKAGELASRYWWMVLAPTVMMSVARGKHGKNDDGSPGSEGAYLGGEVALETAKSYLGPIGGVAADTMLSGHDAKFAPWISTVLRGMVVRGKLAAGQPLTEHEKKDLFESTGIVSHLPAGALYNAMKYVQSVQDGKLEEPIKDLLFRSPGDWK